MQGCVGGGSIIFVVGVAEILPFGSQAACGGVLVAVGAAAFLSLGVTELKSAGVEELLVEEVVAPLVAVGAGKLEQVFPPAWRGCPLSVGAVGSGWMCGSDCFHGPLPMKTDGSLPSSSVDHAADEVFADIKSCRRFIATLELCARLFIYVALFFPSIRAAKSVTYWKILVMHMKY